MNIEVEVRRERYTIWPVLIVALYVMWLVGWLWWIVAAVVVAAMLWQVGRMIEAGNTAKQAILDRAETQHRQVMSGDERGIYGAGYTDWRKYRDT